MPAVGGAPMSRDSGEPRSVPSSFKGEGLHTFAHSLGSNASSAPRSYKAGQGMETGPLASSVQEQSCLSQLGCPRKDPGRTQNSSESEKVMSCVRGDLWGQDNVAKAWIPASCLSLGFPRQGLPERLLLRTTGRAWRTDVL